MRIYRSDDYLMRGNGIGSIFSSIFKGIAPLVKGALGIGTKALKTKGAQKALKDLKKASINAGIDLASDALAGKDLKKSVESQIQNVQDKMSDSIKQMKVNGNNGKKVKRGKKRGSKLPMKKYTKVSKTTRKDIFS